MDPDQDPALLRAKLNLETARIPWPALQGLHAAGDVLAAAPDLDLVEVAVQMARDNSAQIRSWLAAGRLAPVSDDQARAWHAAGAEVWAVVVKPFVLVQDGAARAPGSQTPASGSAADER